MRLNDVSVTLDWHMMDDDPTFSDNQIGFLQTTRDFMDKWLADPELSRRDITSPDTIVG